MGERRQRGDGGGWAPTGGLAGSTRLQPDAGGQQLAWRPRGAPWEPAMTCSTAAASFGPALCPEGPATAAAPARRARGRRRAHLGAPQRTDGRRRRPQAAHAATTRKTSWGLRQPSVALHCCNLSTVMLPTPAVQVSPVIPCTSAAPRAASRRHGARSGSESARPAAAPAAAQPAGWWQQSDAQAVSHWTGSRSAGHTTPKLWPRSVCMLGLRRGSAPLLLLL